MNQDVNFLCYGLFTVFLYVVGLQFGQHLGEKTIKRKILWNIYDYRDKTVKEMFDEILNLTDDDWVQYVKRK